MRKFRKTRGMTQEELAKNSNLSTMSIRRYESGERIVTDEALQRIANALEISIYELKGLSDVEAFKAEFPIEGMFLKWCFVEHICHAMLVGPSQKGYYNS